MPRFSKIIYKGKRTKLEVFNKRHKLFTSLPVHKHALEAGLDVPKLYDVIEKGNKIHKYTEWVKGDTLQHEMDVHPELIEPICMDLGRYVNELYNVDGITAVDSHFQNFVWRKGKVIYIDLKKLLYRKTKEEHILQMSKICLKGCRGEKRKTLAFLIGYSKYRDVTPIIEDCDKREWQWFGMKGQVLRTDPVIIEEIIE